MRPSGLGVALQIPFPVRARAWVVGQVTACQVVGMQETDWCFFFLSLSLSFSLSSPLPKNKFKIFFKKETKQNRMPESDLLPGGWCGFWVLSSAPCVKTLWSWAFSDLYVTQALYLVNSKLHILDYFLQSVNTDWILQEFKQCIN